MTDPLSGLDCLHFIYLLGHAGLWLGVAAVAGYIGLWLHHLWRARRNERQVAAHIAARRGFRAAERGGWVQEDLQ